MAPVSATRAHSSDPLAQRQQPPDKASSLKLAFFQLATSRRDVNLRSSLEVLGYIFQIDTPSRQSPTQ